MWDKCALSTECTEKCLVLLLVCELTSFKSSLSIIMQPASLCMSVLANNLPETRDFSIFTLIENLQQEAYNKLDNLHVSVLVSAAIAREKEAHPTDAAYYVLLKVLKNDSISGPMVSKYCTKFVHERKR